MLQVILPKGEEVVSLVTTVQREFLAMDREDVPADHFDWLDLKRTEEGDFSQPAPVSFVWEPVTEATLQISENPDFSQSIVFSGIGGCSVSSLKCGTRYFCRVVKGEEISSAVAFYTADEMPRFVRVEGTTNVRDCGGWPTLEGKRVEQGLLYRGSELNSHVNATEAGLAVLREELGLRSVLDIRGETEDVKDIFCGGYANIPCRAYDEYLNDPETHRQICAFLAKKENYPVYFHCWGGADRTGTIAFLVGAMLGVGESDLIADYELTSLSIWGVRTRNSKFYRAFRQRLEEFEGESVNEKALAFTLSCGVTQAEVDAIREILLSK